MRYVIDLQGAQTESRYRGIGRYSLNLARAMARLGGNHEIWIVLNRLFPETIPVLRAEFDQLVPQERIVSFTAAAPVSGFFVTNSWRRLAAEKIREHFLSSLAPDMVHVSSLFEGVNDDAVSTIETSESNFSTAVTLYDLIPLLKPEQHLSRLEVKRHYLQEAQALKRADLLLAISESSRREAIEALHIPPDHVVNISTGIDDKFRVVDLAPDAAAAFLRRLGIARSFVMYSGAPDPRKNVEGLLEAFASLPEPLRAQYQLVLAGRHDSRRREQLEESARRLGLREDEVLLLGFVHDEDLIVLYNLCSLFVFPSFHEGFGLPVLEAMACGAPAIASNMTSLPEVMPRPDALFDPHQPAEIAARMQRGLVDESFRRSLGEYGLQRAREFTWERCAKLAWDALEDLYRRKSAVGKGAHSVGVSGRTGKLSLAYFSPLPPARSGIADYSAELLPELGRFYEIDVIVDQEEVSDDWILANFPVRDPAYFEEHFSKYDRILYHLGNSPFHTYMFECLRRHPGVVVLHDFYLSGVAHWREACENVPGAFTHAIYESHGYAGLLQYEEHGSDWAVRTLPCNRWVIEAAAGIIVHSDFSRNLAHRWYGPALPSGWERVPMLKGPQTKDRNAARARLGIRPEDYVVCSFGILDISKLNDRLLSSWLASDLSKADTTRLIFVGENIGEPYHTDYSRRLLERIQTSGLGNRILITGFASVDAYRDYLTAADCAVQLRSESRGETSAALLDCLAYGVPTILNSNGSFAEIEDGAALKLSAEFSDADLVNALDRIYSDPEYRTTLGKSAQELVVRRHHPARIGEMYRNAIELFTRTGPMAIEQRLLRDIANLDACVAAEDEDLMQTARAVAMQRPPRQRQLLLDVSATAKNNLKSGIERIARNIALQFMRSPGELRVEPVRQIDGRWFYARQFALETIGVRADLNETALECRPGDIYLALDWSPATVYGAPEFFVDLRARNVSVYFVVYDLLPLLHPEMFPAWAAEEFRKWLEAVCQVADGIACDSRTVADELLAWLNLTPPDRLGPLKIGYFHQGANLQAGFSFRGNDTKVEPILKELRKRPSILMVGTVEPRKGYEQALSAFERLWQDGIDANLVIVGKEGWDVDPLIKRLQSHPRANRSLFWLSRADDEVLTKIYGAASGLLAASVGEGFGLPLIEAAHYKLPIMARDIPVFREVAGDHAFYFAGDTPDQLASALKTWIEQLKTGAAPPSEPIKYLSWKESAQQLREFVFGQRVYKEWQPARVDYKA